MDKQKENVLEDMSKVVQEINDKILESSFLHGNRPNSCVIFSNEIISPINFVVLSSSSIVPESLTCSAILLAITVFVLFTYSASSRFLTSKITSE